MDDSEKEELKNLNMAVKQAISDRKAWLDEKMIKYAKFKVGDEIFNVNIGESVGIVSKPYRFWAERDEGLRDTSLDIDYEYCAGGNCYSNTSSQPYVRFGTKEDVMESFQGRLKVLSNK